MTAATSAHLSGEGENSGIPQGFTEVARGYYLEALLIDGDAIWYTDVVLGGVRRVGSDQIVLPDRRMVGGLLLNADGSLLVAGEDGIAWSHPETGASGMLVEGLGGVNEMRADGRGGIYFGTIDLASILLGKRPGPSAIWHLSADRQLKKLRDGLAFANGLSPSQDGRLLFFNESFAATQAFPIAADGSLGDPVWRLDKLDCDGMALDGDGNIWLSGFSSGELLCLAPHGAELARLALPGAACTNVRFGGPDMRDIYVAIVHPAAAQALADGKVPDQLTSMICKMRSPVAGAAMAKSSFRLA